MPLKITTWNIEHSGRLVTPTPSAEALERRRRIRETVEAIDRDILACRRAHGEKSRRRRSRRTNPGRRVDAYYVAALRRFADDARPGVRDERDAVGVVPGAEFAGRTVKLQPPTTWAAFTGGTNWRVHRWGEEVFAFHEHHRHPQVLLFDAAPGLEIEPISVHLKSKINQLPIQRDAAGDIIGAYLREALEARIKLELERETCATTWRPASSRSRTRRS